MPRSPLFSRRTEPGVVVDEVGQDIVQRWRRGDQTAFSELFRTYRQLVYGVLHHLLRGDPELEDVVQTAFLEIFRSLDKFEGRSRLSSWITRVALNVGYHHIRRRKSRPTDYETERVEADMVDTSSRADPHDAFERNEVQRRVAAIIDSMPARKRSVFILNDFQGVSQEEIAEIVGANIATVRTRLFYARKEFTKKALEDPVLRPLIGTSAVPRAKRGERES